MIFHDLKIDPVHYWRVRNGTKTFEIRVNDRGYQQGDAVNMYYFDRSEAARRLGSAGEGTPLNFWATNKNLPPLQFTIGAVYPIDENRVVFSLINLPQYENGVPKT